MDERIRAELLPGEELLWNGQPRRDVVFHKADFLLIPFSVAWAGIACSFSLPTLWPRIAPGAGRPPDLGSQLFALMFFLVAQYILWGRFFYAAWQKGDTEYALTNMRVIVSMRTLGGRKTGSLPLEAIYDVGREVRSSGIGSIRFRKPRKNDAWTGLGSVEAPVFVDIDDADRVYRQVLAARERAKQKF